MVWLAALKATGVAQFVPGPLAVDPLVVVSRSGSVFMLNPDTGILLKSVGLPCADEIISAAVLNSMLFGSEGSVLETV